MISLQSRESHLSIKHNIEIIRLDLRDENWVWKRRLEALHLLVLESIAFNAGNPRQIAIAIIKRLGFWYYIKFGW